MTPGDEGQDRELMERYGQASRADPRAPSAAVRAAILNEGRRVAASLAAVSLEPARRRTFRWRMTAWGTAAAALLATLIIAPRLWNQAPPTHMAAISNPTTSFDQAARKTEPPESAAGPRPVVPVVPVPGPQLEDLPPRLVADAPSVRRPAAPPPVHIPEQSVEISPVSRSAQSAESASVARARGVNPSYTAGGNAAPQSADAATPLLTAAVAAGDLAKTSQLLDQGAAINDHDATGRTPLMLAIGENRLDAVQLLLTRGADPNAADQHGLTPLQLAQQSNFNDIAAVLVKAGAH